MSNEQKHKQKTSPETEHKDKKASSSDQESSVEQAATSSKEDKPLKLAALPLEVKAHIEELEQQLAASQDQALRAVADAQNTIRRAQKDVEAAHKYALERFVTSLLAVVDNLERALQIDHSDSKAMKPFVEGVELTYKSFIDVLKRFNVNQVDPRGEPFDPQLHQAVTTVENPDTEPNSVVDVMQKGYQLNGRLIRPAMVVVSKAAGVNKQASKG